MTAVHAALDIMREIGRPMHGLREIWPALEKRGFAFKHRGSLAGSLLKTGKVDRVAPGTFVLRKEGGT